MRISGSIFGPPLAPLHGGGRCSGVPGGGGGAGVPGAGPGAGGLGHQGEELQPTNPGPAAPPPAPGAPAHPGVVLQGLQHPQHLHLPHTAGITQPLQHQG